MNSTNVEDFSTETFSILLEQEKGKFLNAALSVLEFERTFQAKAEWATDNNKDGYFITAIEHECTVKLYRSIHEALITSYGNLTSSLKHQRVQLALLEACLQDEILKSARQSLAKQSSAA